MQKIKELIKKLQSSKEFKGYKKNNPDSYLCAFFQMEHPQLDYYNKKTKEMTTFTINTEIETKTTNKIFQKERRDVEELKMDEIKVNLDKAINEIDKISKKQGIKQLMKRIIILQKIKIPIWNISYITSDFKILNVKINAIDGKIIDEKIDSVIKFKTQ